MGIPFGDLGEVSGEMRMAKVDALGKYRKKRGVHKISARNSGARNGCASFMGAWHFRVLSAGKPPCP